MSLTIMPLLKKQQTKEDEEEKIVTKGKSGIDLGIGDVPHFAQEKVSFINQGVIGSWLENEATTALTRYRNGSEIQVGK